MESQLLATPDNGDSPLLLDVKGVAQLLTVSERTVWRLREDGQLPAVKIRGAVRFRRGDVERYAAGEAD